MENNKIVKYYGKYTEKQAYTSINIRHYFLMKKIIKVGLKKTDKVLEIGCGVRTILLVTYLKHGKVLTTDIRRKSIKIAKERLRNKTNVDFQMTDMIKFSNSDKFDFIILPEMLEHIPIESHNRFFSALAK